MGLCPCLLLISYNHSIVLPQEFQTDLPSYKADVQYSSKHSQSQQRSHLHYSISWQRKALVAKNGNPAQKKLSVERAYIFQATT